MIEVSVTVSFSVVFASVSLASIAQVTPTFEDVSFAFDELVTGAIFEIDLISISFLRFFVSSSNICSKHFENSCASTLLTFAEDLDFLFNAERVTARWRFV